MNFEYIYDREGYIKSLIEVFEYCEVNKLVCNRVFQDKDDYGFQIKINKDAVLNIYTELNTIDDFILVNLHFEPNTIHSKFVKDRFQNMKFGGGLLGGLVGFVALAAPGIGLGAGIITAAISFIVGSTPGYVLNKTDEIVSNSIIKACEIHINKLTLLFNSNLLNTDTLLKDIDKNACNKWVNSYIENNNLKVISFKVKVRSGLKTKEKIIHCNSYSDTKKITIYNTFDK